MKIAIVHDWLVTLGGAEKVLEQILRIYPEADLFSTVDFLSDEQRKIVHNKRAKTTFIQRLPFARKKYRSYLPLMPIAIEQLDLRGYDLVISSSHAVAKGVITGPDQIHVSYVYTPIRYVWDMQFEYLEDFGLTKGLKSMIVRMILHYVRNWDARTANGVDSMVAISEFISRRIRKVYRREAEVIYPPVNVEGFRFSEQKEDYYLTASRLVPYKKIDLIVEAFKLLPDKKLIVIGDGPDAKKIKSLIGPNIEFLGYQPTEVLHEYMQKAKAFVFAAEEDFGIVPLEAQACGTPVIAFGRGGALETIRSLDCDEPTGVFFREQNISSLVDAVKLFENNSDSIKPIYCRKNALRFSEERFREEFEALVARHLVNRRSPQLSSNPVVLNKSR